MGVFKCFQKWQVFMVFIYMFGRDKAVRVSIGPRYGLGVQSLGGRGGENNCTRPNWTWGPPTSYTIGTVSFPGVKPPRSDFDHPPPLSTEVKERIELYLYSLSVPFWQVTWWSSHLHTPTHTLNVKLCLCWSVSHLKSFLKRVNMTKYAKSFRTCVFYCVAVKDNVHVW